jgi:hypothetical protein
MTLKAECSTPGRRHDAAFAETFHSVT